MVELSALSLLPPLLAIVLAIATRQVYLSLAAGVWIGWTILLDWNPLAGAGGGIEGAIAVLGDAGNARVILFTLVIGALIATIETAGGVTGFVEWVERKRWVESPKRARILAWLLGTVIFIESNITVLVSGSIARPLFDRYKESREKLAYLIDSTSAPVCILVPLNAWGAYILGILGTLGVASPLQVLVQSIAFNFYAIFAWLLAGSSAIWGFNLGGGMKRAAARVEGGELLRKGSVPALDVSVLGGGEAPLVEPRASLMIVPVIVMIVAMPLGLYITGGGDITAGSGSTSVLWAVLAALLSTWLLLVPRGVNLERLIALSLKGAGGLVGLAFLLLLALALGNVARELRTGEYVAAVTQGVFPPYILLPLIFLVAGGIAFSTGTSWGTFAIMLPIAVPTAAVLGLPLAPFIAASLSGGIFGDHASPISDTTIISSMASAVDHIDHVRTQLPYALLAGTAAIIAYAITGFMIG
ncbi:Na+/H+ antiporter NhaC family protein [soil metagenome]